MSESNAALAPTSTEALDTPEAGLRDEALDRAPGKGAVCYMCDY